jgi:hypothetical protein
MRSKFKFFAFFVTLTALGFTACSDDDDDDNAIEFESSAIVGVWNIDAMTTTIVTSGDSETGVEEPDILMEFKEDGTGVAANEMVFTWSLSNNLLTLAFESSDEEVAGPPMGGGANFNFEDLAAFEEIVLTVTALDDSYMAVEYAGSYPGTSVTMVMELSR